MRRAAMLGIAVVGLVASSGWAREPMIAARSLSPQEIVDYGLAEDMQTSGGLFTAGIGSPVYLEALVLTGTQHAGVAWSLTGPAGSSASLQESPLGNNVPTYVPGDQTGYEVAGRQLLVPDVVGQYRLSATVGDTALTATVTAATYVGVGTVDGATAQYPQCGMCHADVASSWEETGHGTFFTEAVDGIASSHYSGDCVSCHNVGYDESPAAANGGFDDVAAQLGWTFPEVLEEGNWAAIPAALQAVSNIQCENCHGPGSQHGGSVTDNRISVSYNAGSCSQCHDDGTHHIKSQEWENSLHASNVDEGGRDTCVGCHSGIGFVERIDGVASADRNLEHAAIGCATCHDPHDATNPHQVRTTDDVELMDGTVVSEGGAGKICMNCHMARVDADTYVTEYHSRFGPHHGPQTDMLVGTNAVEYGQTIRRSSHLYAAEDACATCHMQEVASTEPEFTLAGGHTFKPAWDAGTPDDESDDVYLTAACAGCHGPMTSFDVPRDDYDGDGTVEGVQTEVKGLMRDLAMHLPPLDQPTVSVTSSYTAKQLKAAYNYTFVEEDRSNGIHNPQYAMGILRASIRDITGREVGTGGGVRSLSSRPERTGGLVASGGLAGGIRSKAVPTGFGLHANFPNPFNPETEICYGVPEPTSVRIDIYNSLGQRVRTLVDAHHGAGEYAATWDGRDMDGRKVTAGVYVYTMRAGTFVEGRKMLLMP